MAMYTYTSEDNNFTSVSSEVIKKCEFFVFFSHLFGVFMGDLRMVRAFDEFSVVFYSTLYQVFSIIEEIFPSTYAS